MSKQLEDAKQASAKITGNQSSKGILEDLAYIKAKQEQFETIVRWVDKKHQEEVIKQMFKPIKDTLEKQNNSIERYLKD